MTTTGDGDEKKNGRPAAGRGDRTNYFRLYYLRNKERIRKQAHEKWLATGREERNTLYRTCWLQDKYRKAGLHISRAEARKLLGIDRPRKPRPGHGRSKWADMPEDERRVVVYVKKCRECGIKMTYAEARRILNQEG